MNTYADKLVDSILDGTTPIESINVAEEMAKIGLAFARDAIREAEEADTRITERTEAAIVDD